MNKIIITGHPESGFGSVEALLLRCGMRPALPSLREGLLPKDIHHTLRTAHHVPESRSISCERGFSPVSIGPVWHGMAMDLLLGNLNQEPWGWADPDTVFFLEYWRSLDPESIFVLVYDSPASALRENSFDPSVVDAEAAMRALLDNWAAYNSAMLRFYFQHPERCLLVHSRQLHGDARCGLQEIQGRLSAPLPDPDADAGLFDYSLLPEDVDLLGTVEPPPTVLKIAPLLEPENPTARFLTEFQLDRLPQYRDLYDELQAAANLPLETEESTHAYSIDALISWLRERKSFAQAMRRLDDHCQDLETKLRFLKRDHELTFLQHAQACEELGQVLLENRALRLELESLEIPEPEPEPESEPPLPTGAAERVKNQLSYRLGSLMVVLAKNPLGILVLPFSLIGETLKFRGEKRTRQQNLPPLHEYADFEQSQKVKKQLSYRLGNTLVRRCKSPLGWIILPFALARQVQTFHRSRRSNA
jgi:hypothetical protein